MTASPLEITSVPSDGMYLSVCSRRILEFMLKICFVAAVIATSLTSLSMAIFGTLTPVKDVKTFRGLCSMMNDFFDQYRLSHNSILFSEHLNNCKN